MLLASSPIVGSNNPTIGTSRSGGGKEDIFSCCQIFCMVISKPTKNNKVMCSEFDSKMAYIKKEKELLGTEHMGRLVLKWTI